MWHENAEFYPNFLISLKAVSSTLTKPEAKLVANLFDCQGIVKSEKVT